MTEAPKRKGPEVKDDIVPAFETFATPELQVRIGKIGHPDGRPMDYTEANEVAADLFNETNGETSKVTDDLIATSWAKKRAAWNK